MQSKRNILHWFIKGVFLVLAASLIVLGVPSLIADRYASPRLYSVDSVPSSRVAIVFGAGLTRSGGPSPILRDRVDTAIRLYENKKVEKLLMSGDNRFVDYNEPGAMAEYAISKGVPESDIVLDFAGRRTYDTCYRARHIFGVEQAVLVTQEFHMPRAVFTCNQLGLDATGVVANNRPFLRRFIAYWSLREVPATTVAVWEVWVSRPLPVLGNPEPIFTNEITIPVVSSALQ